MKQVSVLVLLCLCAFSCGQVHKKSDKGDNSEPLPDVRKTFVETAVDSTSSWQRVYTAALPFVDSLCSASADENSLRRRLYGQEWGYLTIGVLSDKYSRLLNAGEEVSSDEFARTLEQLSDAMSLWFYSEDDILPCIWRDHYYTCNQNADNPVDGYFHIMITLPTEEDPAPSLQIFYPMAAEGNPYIMFAGLDNQDNSNKQEVIQLKDWQPKDSIAMGYPMYAEADVEIVNKMLKNDVMYLMFTSEATADGSPGETEIARVYLQPMQRIWERVNNK